MKKEPRTLKEILQGMISHRDDLSFNAKAGQARAYKMLPGTDRWKTEIDAAMNACQAGQLDIFLPDIQALAECEALHRNNLAPLEAGKIMALLPKGDLTHNQAFAFARAIETLHGIS
jgi:hypothetical protein